MCRHVSVRNGCLVDDRTIVILPGNSVVIYGGSIGCGISSIACYCHNFRTPTCKGVRVLSVCCFCWISMSRRSTVSHFCLVDNRPVIILPSNSIFINGGSISCCVSCITNDRFDSRTPSCKRVGVLCIGCFRWISMRRNNSVSNFCLVDDRTIIVLPSNNILIDCGSVGCRVSSISGYNCQCRTPTGESICVLRRVSFRSICMCRHVSIRNSRLVDDRTIVVLPSNSVVIYGGSIGCGISSITCHCHYFRTPTGEGVGILCICIFMRVSVSRS